MPVGNESVKKRYLQIKDGKIVEFKGETTWNTYSHISRVHLVNIAFRQVKKDKNDNNSPIIGNMVQLHLIDADDYFVLEFWYNGTYAKCFYNIMENLDVLQEISVFTDEKLQDGKKRQSLFIRQSNGYLKHKYTRENLGECPPLQESFIADDSAPNGQKKVLNDDLQMAFFLDKVKYLMIPRLEMKLNPFPNHMIFSGMVGEKVAGNHFTQSTLGSSETVDDLPF